MHECSADAEAQRASAVVGAERRHHDRTGLHQQGFRGLKPGEMGEDVTGGSTACHVYDKERWEWVCTLLYGTLACCLCARMRVFGQRLEGCAPSFGSPLSFLVRSEAHTRNSASSTLYESTSGVSPVTVRVLLLWRGANAQSAESRSQPLPSATHSPPTSARARHTGSSHPMRSWRAAHGPDTHVQ